MKREGFTLVELLVVIVVLGLLIALAMPTIVDALETSKKNIFVEQLKVYSANVLTKYSDNKVFDGAETPTCYGIEGIKEDKSYQGYVIISSETGRVESIHIYNKEYAYEGSLTDLIEKKGKAIERLTVDEHKAKVVAIDEGFKNPDNNCVEFHSKNKQVYTCFFL